MNSRPRPMVVILLSVGLIAFTFLFLLPVLSPWLHEAGWMPKGWNRISPTIDAVQTNLMRGLVVVWFGFLGACFASFLNVVAWRVPRGRVITGSSHCPQCDSRLAMTDNMPVVGWLRNGGCCRFCAAPIPVRYLIVELALGMITLMIAWLTVFWGGINLPGFESAKFQIIPNLVGGELPVRYGFFLIHLLLIYLLFTFTVIRSERLKLPVSVWLVGMIFGIVGVSTFPALVPLTWNFELHDYQAPLSRFERDHWSTLVVGVGSGGLIGYVVSKLNWLADAESITANECDFASEASIDSHGFDSASDAVEVESQTAPLPSEQQEPVLPVDLDHEIAIESPSPSDGSTEAIEAKRHPEVVTLNEGFACLSLVGLILGWQLMLLAALLMLVWVPIRMWMQWRTLDTLSVQCLINIVVVILAYRWILEAISLSKGVSAAF